MIKKHYPIKNISKIILVIFTINSLLSFMSGSNSVEENSNGADYKVEEINSINKSYTDLQNILNNEVEPLNFDSLNSLQFVDKINLDLRQKPGIKTITKEWFHNYSNVTQTDTLTPVPHNCRIYKYSKNGLLKNEYLAYKTDTISCISYRYNSAGNLIAVIERNLESDMSWEYFFIYDKSGKFIRKSSHQYRGNYLTIYNYDSLGRINKELMINEGKIHGVKKHSFIRKTALIEKTEITSKAVNSSFQYKYDNEGNLTFQTSKSTFTGRQDSITYEYNPNGELELKNSTSSFGQISERFEYKYNAAKDWIKMTKYYNGKKTDVIIRKIDYY